ncbi:response regulator [Bacillus sp. N9]
MIKMVVIEDELRLCHGIAFHIPWEKHDIEVVGVAYDGESGIRIIKEKNPDIVITDIRMPNMSGLDMIRELNKEDGNMKFIIISGYDDFQYAQNAMSMGVTNYIVKPTGEEKIIDEVNKVKEEIIIETRNKQRLDLLEQKWSENLPRLQEQFFQHWLSQQYTDDEILERAKTLQLPIRTNQYYLIAIFSIDDLPHEEKETSQHIYDFSVLRCINEYESAKNFQAFTAPHGSAAVMFWSEKNQGKNAFIQSTNQLINEWLLHIRRSLNLMVSAGIGNCIKAKEKVRISYEQANSALLSRDYFGYNVAIPMRRK